MQNSPNEYKENGAKVDSNGILDCRSINFVGVIPDKIYLSPEYTRGVCGKVGCDPIYPVPMKTGPDNLYIADEWKTDGDVLSICRNSASRVIAMSGALVAA